MYTRDKRLHLFLLQKIAIEWIELDDSSLQASFLMTHNLNDLIVTLPDIALGYNNQSIYMSGW